MKKITVRDSIIFFQGLHSLLSTGLGLVPSLELQVREHPRLAQAVIQIITCLREGKNFSTSLSHYFQLPDGIEMLIRLGEQSGDLAQACALCVTHLQRQQAWKRMIWQLSFYPALLVLTSIVLVSVMMGFVLPEFASLYNSLNVSLPRSTAWLLSFASWAPGQLKNLASVIFMIVLGLCIAWRTEHGRFSIERGILRLPGAKRILGHHYEYQIALHVGTLLQAGSPLLEALDFLRSGSRSPFFKQYLLEVQQRIRLGRHLRSSFCHSWEQEHAFRGLLSHAEQTGQLDKILLNLANQHTESFVHRQERAKHMIQPIITLIMGIFLGMWILLLYYPMLQLGTNLG